MGRIYKKSATIKMGTKTHAQALSLHESQKNKSNPTQGAGPATFTKPPQYLGLSNPQGQNIDKLSQQNNTSFVRGQQNLFSSHSSYVN